MAKIIEFYIPQSFHKVSKWLPPDDRGKVLLLHFTVEDEGVFTTPWTSTITYRRSTGPWTELRYAMPAVWMRPRMASKVSGLTRKQK